VTRFSAARAGQRNQDTQQSPPGASVHEKACRELSSKIGDPPEICMLPGCKARFPNDLQEMLARIRHS
jgi:hypothetical protein